MKKIILENDIILYHFANEIGHFIGVNVLVIVNGKEALLIDTGYRLNYLHIRLDLRMHDIKVKHIVVSHFHPDHIGGLKKIKNINVYGSCYANESLIKFNEYIDHLLPTIVVKDEKTINFGIHKILLEKNIGHSKDGILITIDDKYLFVGDDLVYSNNGTPLLPFCADQIIENHILSINKIKEASIGKTIIPSHGKILIDQEIIQKDLDNRLLYLKYFIKNKEHLYEDFEKETGIIFKGKKSHNYNIKKEVKKWKNGI